MEKFIEVKTKDNITAYIRKDHITGVEEVLTGSKTEPHIKIFAAGFSWTVKGLSLKDVLEKL